MKYEYLYVCDGNVPNCKKTHCSYLETGKCRHTTDESHALYPAPHEWAWEAKDEKKHTFCEAVR